MKKSKRKIIKIDESKCDGCGACIPNCPEGALAVVDTENGPKVRLIKQNFCDGLGACLGNCPKGALEVVEEVAEEYDEAGVIKHIKETQPEKLKPHLEHLRKHGMGCPGTEILSWGDEKDKAGETK